MIIEASVTGAFRTILIIIGVLVLLRFIGQFMKTKRNMDEERMFNEQSRRTAQEKKAVSKNYGKTKIIKNSNTQNVEDVDHEELG
ncbi:MAG: hypothetical protein QNK23_18860 [Crocinitomicaceae bacterium]|nr:hypothetical protein [Crocinitomicaceae bacterium]